MRAVLVCTARSVVEVNPEKQGLKPELMPRHRVGFDVVEVNPEKQGLKPPM